MPVAVFFMSANIVIPPDMQAWPDGVAHVAAGAGGFAPGCNDFQLRKIACSKCKQETDDWDFIKVLDSE